MLIRRKGSTYAHGVQLMRRLIQSHSSTALLSLILLGLLRTLIYAKSTSPDPIKPAPQSSLPVAQTTAQVTAQASPPISPKPNAQSAQRSQQDQGTSLALPPFIVTLGYQSYRADRGDAAYLSGDGGSLALAYQREALTASALRLEWGTMMAYMVSADIEHLTPSANALLNPQSVDPNDVMNDLNSSNAEITSPVSRAPLTRPGESERDLGARQRVSLGASLSLSDVQSRWSLSLSAGGVWRSDEVLSPLAMWGCFKARLNWFWTSGSLGGDPCWGLIEARSRLLFGAYLGRAQIGVGWATDSHSWDALEYEQGGLLGWVRVPLSAPLYLELNAWYPQRARLGGSGGDDALRQAGEGRAFGVSLSWTGEEIAPERAAPKTQRGPAQPNSPTASPPRDPHPSPTSPFGPSRGPSPSSPLAPPRSPPTSPSGSPL